MYAQHLCWTSANAEYCHWAWTTKLFDSWISIFIFFPETFRYRWLWISKMWLSSHWPRSHESLKDPLELIIAISRINVFLCSRVTGSWKTRLKCERIYPIHWWDLFALQLLTKKVRLVLIRAALGAGNITPPEFCVINQEPRKLSTTNVQYLRLQCDLCCENLVEICRKILGKWQFYDSATRDFRAKSGQYSNGHFSFNYQAILIVKHHKTQNVGVQSC